MNQFMHLAAVLASNSGWHVAKMGDIELAIRGSVVRKTPPISAFIPMAVLIASRLNRDLHIEGAISSTLLAKLSCELSPFVERYFGGHRVAITADKISSEIDVRPGKSALMFSAGIDSFYSLHLLRNIGITPDAFLNVHAGAHDDNLETWNVRLNNVNAVATALGIPLLTIETNFHRAYKEAHVRCHTFRNISAAIAASEVSTIYYSAAHEVTDLSFDAAKRYGLDFIDPAIIRSFLPTGLDTIYLGWDANRIKRTAEVSKMPLAFEHLDVCTNQKYQANRGPCDPINCGKCTKCIRTLIALELSGGLDNFGKAFDIVWWRKSKLEAAERLSASPHPIDINAVEVAKSAKIF
ncbi:hypothetical protein RLW55_15470 [Hyphomicrobium sp. B1]|uniref:hypothetical protein n=1 Tax=Hyphomicrobium sp. B1 TaxID=3075651 RepID=UPI003C3010AA